jgi:hypothetical protein
MNHYLKDALMFLCLLLVFVATMVWGYASGDFYTLFRHKTPEERARAQQALLDRTFGSDQAFDASTDDVTITAAGKTDTVSWKTLSHAAFKAGKSAGIIFGEEVKSIDGHEITITGYIFPLEASGDQRHFLLSAYPPSCPYCLPGGATELIEVMATSPITFTYQPITIHGKFQILSGEDVKEGMFYRVVML